MEKNASLQGNAGLEQERIRKWLEFQLAMARSELEDSQAMLVKTQFSLQIEQAKCQQLEEKQVKNEAMKEKLIKKIVQIEESVQKVVSNNKQVNMNSQFSDLLECEKSRREDLPYQLQVDLAETKKLLAVSEASLKVKIRHCRDLELEKLRMQKDLLKLEKIIQESKNLYGQTEHDIHTMKCALHNKEQDVLTISQKLQEALSASEVLEKTIRAQETSLQVMKIENDKLKEAAKEQASRHSVLQKEAEKATLMNKDLTEQLSRDVQKQTLLYIHAHGQLKEKEAVLRNERQKAIKAKAQQDALQERLEKVQNEGTLLSQQLEAANMKAEAKEREMADMQEHLKRMHTENEMLALQDKMKKVQSECTLLSRQLEVANMKAEAKEQEVIQEHLKRMHTVNEILVLQDKLEKVGNECKLLSQQLEVANMKAEAKEQEFMQEHFKTIQIENEMLTLQNKLEMVQNEGTLLSQQLEVANKKAEAKELEVIQEHLKTAHTVNEILAIQERLEKVKKEGIMLNQQLEEANKKTETKEQEVMQERLKAMRIENEMLTLHDKLEKLQNEGTLLSKQLEAANKKAEAKEQEVIQEHFKRMQTENKILALQERLEKVQIEGKQLSQQQETANKKAEAKEQDVLTVSQKLQEALSASEVLEKTIRTKETSLQVMKIENDKLKEAAKEQASRHSVLQKEAEKATLMNKDLTEQLSRDVQKQTLLYIYAHGQLKEKEAVLWNERQKAIKAKAQQDALQERLEKVQNEGTLLSQQLEAANMKAEAKEREMADMQEHLKRMHTENEMLALQDKMEKVQNECRLLSQQLEVANMKAEAKEQEVIQEYLKRMHIVNEMLTLQNKLEMVQNEGTLLSQQLEVANKKAEAKEQEVIQEHLKTAHTVNEILAIQERLEKVKNERIMLNQQLEEANKKAETKEQEVMQERLKAMQIENEMLTLHDKLEKLQNEGTLLSKQLEVSNKKAEAKEQEVIQEHFKRMQTENEILALQERLEKVQIEGKQLSQQQETANKKAEAKEQDVLTVSQKLQEALSASEVLEKTIRAQETSLQVIKIENDKLKEAAKEQASRHSVLQKEAEKATLMNKDLTEQLSRDMQKQTLLYIYAHGQLKEKEAVLRNERQKAIKAKAQQDALQERLEKVQNEGTLLSQQLEAANMKAEAKEREMADMQEHLKRMHTENEMLALQDKMEKVQSECRLLIRQLEVANKKAEVKEQEVMQEHFKTMQIESEMLTLQNKLEKVQNEGTLLSQQLEVANKKAEAKEQEVMQENFKTMQTENEMLALQDRLEKVQNEGTQLSQQLEVANKKAEAKEQEVMQEHLKRVHTENEMVALQDKLEEVQNESIQLSQQLEVAKKKAEAKEQEVMQEHLKRTQTENEMLALLERLENVQTESTLLSKQLEMANKKAETKELEVAEMQEQLKAVHSEKEMVETSKKKVMELLSQERRELQQVLANTQTKLTMCKGLLEIHTLFCSVLQEENISMEKNVSMLKQLLVDSEDSCTQAESFIHNLIAKLNEKDNDIVDASQRLLVLVLSDSRNNEPAHERTEIQDDPDVEDADSWDTVWKLQQKLADTKINLLTCQTSLKVSTNHCRDLEDEKQSILKNMNALQGNLREIEDNYAKSEQHIHNLKASGEEKDNQICTLSKQLQLLSASKSTKMSASKKAEVHDGEDRERQNTLQQLQKELADTKMRLSAHEASLKVNAKHCRDLEEEKNSMQEEIHALKERLWEHEDKCAQSEQQVSILRASCEDKDHEIHSLSKKLQACSNSKSMEPDLKNLEIQEHPDSKEKDSWNRVRQLEQKLADAKINWLTCEASLKVNINHCRDLEQKNESMQKDMNTLKRNMREMEDKYAKSEQHIHNLKASCEEKDNQIFTLSKHLQLLSASKSTKMSASKKAEVHDGEERERQNTLQQLQKELADTKMRLSAHEASLKVNAKHCRDLEEEKHSMQEDIHALSGRLWEREDKCAQLELRVCNLTASCEDKDHQMHALSKKLQACSNLRNKETDLEILEIHEHPDSEDTDSWDTVWKLEQKLADAKVNLLTCGASLKVSANHCRGLEDKNESLQKNISTLKGNLRKMEDMYSQSEQHVHNLKASGEEKDNQICTLSKQLQLLSASKSTKMSTSKKAKAHDGEERDRQNTLQQLQKELADTKMRLSAHEASLKVNTKHCRDLEEEKNSLQEEIHALKERLWESENKCVQSEQHVSNLTASCEDKDHQIHSLSKKLQVCSNSRSKETDLKNTQMQEHPDSEETYMQNIVSQIQKELADTKIKLSTCETTLKVSANHCRELEEEKESMQKNMRTLKGNLREMEDMHAQSEQHIHNLVASGEEKDNQICTLSKQLQLLSASKSTKMSASKHAKAHDGEERDRQNTLQQLQKELADTKMRLSAHEASLKVNAKHCRDLDEEKNSMQEEIHALKERLWEHEDKCVQSEQLVSILRASCEDKDHQIHSLSKKLQACSNSRSKEPDLKKIENQEYLDNKEVSIQNTVSQNQQELADTKIKLSTCEASLKVSIKHCRDLEDEKESMQKNMSTLKGNLREMEDMRAQLEQHVHNLKASGEEKDNQICTLSKQLQLLSASKSTKMSASKKAKVHDGEEKERQNTLQQLHKELADTKMKQSAHEASLKVNAKHCRDLDEEKNSMQEEIHALKERLWEHEDKCVQSEQLVSILRASCEDKDHQIHSLSKKLQACSNSRSKEPDLKKKENQEYLDNKEVSIQNTVSQNQQELADTKIKLSTCEASLKVSIKHCRDLEDEKESMQKNMSTLKGNLREMEDMRAQLEQHVHNLKASGEEKDNQICTLSKQLQLLSASKSTKMSASKKAKVHDGEEKERQNTLQQLHKELADTKMKQSAHEASLKVNAKHCRDLDEEKNSMQEEIHALKERLWEHEDKCVQSEQLVSILRASCEDKDHQIHSLSKKLQACSNSRSKEPDLKKIENQEYLDNKEVSIQNTVSQNQQELADTKIKLSTCEASLKVSIKHCRDLEDEKESMQKNMSTLKGNLREMEDMRAQLEQHVHNLKASGEEKDHQICTLSKQLQLLSASKSTKMSASKKAKVHDGEEKERQNTLQQLHKELADTKMKQSAHEASLKVNAKHCRDLDEEKNSMQEEIHALKERLWEHEDKCVQSEQLVSILRASCEDKDHQIHSLSKKLQACSNSRSKEPDLKKKENQEYLDNKEVSIQNTVSKNQQELADTKIKLSTCEASLKVSIKHCRDLEDEKESMQKNMSTLKGNLREMEDMRAQLEQHVHNLKASGEEKDNQICTLSKQLQLLSASKSTKMSASKKAKVHDGEEKERQNTLQQLQKELADTKMRLSAHEASLKVNAKHCRDLDEEKNSMQEEIHALKERLWESENKCVQSEQRVSNLTASCEDKDHQIHSLSKKLQVCSNSRSEEPDLKKIENQEHLDNKETSVQNTMSQNQQELADTKIKLSTCEASLKVSIKHCRDLEDEKESMQKNMSTLKENLQEMEDMRAQLEQHVHNLKASGEEKDNQICTLSKQLQLLSSSKSTKMSASKKAKVLDGEERERQNTLQQLQKELADTKMRLSAHEASLKVNAKHCRDLDEEKNSMQEEIHALKERLWESENKCVQSEQCVSNLTASCEDKDHQIHSLSKKLQVCSNSRSEEPDLKKIENQEHLDNKETSVQNTMSQNQQELADTKIKLSTCEASLKVSIKHCRDLEDEKESMQKNMSTLKGNLQEMEDMRAQLEQHVHNLKASGEEKDNQICTLSKQLQLLSSSKSTKMSASKKAKVHDGEERERQNTLQQLQKELADTKMKQSAHEVSLKVNAKHCRDLEEEKNLMQEEIHALKGRLWEHEDKCAQSEQRVSNLTAACEDKDHQIYSLSKKLQACSNSKSMEPDLKNTEMQEHPDSKDTDSWDMVWHLEQKLADAKINLLTCEASLKVNTNHCKDLEDKNESMQKDMNTLNRNLRKMEDMYSQSEQYVHNLMASCEEKDNQICTLSKQLQLLSASKSTKMSASKKAEVHDSEERERQNTLQQLQKELADTKMRLSAHEASLKVNAKHCRDLDEEKNSMQEEIHALKERLWEHEDKCAQSEQRVSNLTASCEIKDHQIHSLSKKLQACLNSRSKEPDLKYTENLEHLDNKETSPQNSMPQNQQELADTEIKLSTCEASLKVSIKHCRYLEDEKESMQINISTLKENLRKMEDMHAQSEQYVRNLMATCEEKDNQICTLSKQLQLLSASKSTKMSASKKAKVHDGEEKERQNTLQQLQKELADTKMRLSAHEASLKVNAKHCRDLEEEKNSLQEEIHALKERLWESENKCVQSEQHVSNLTASCEDKDHQIHSLSKKLQVCSNSRSKETDLKNTQMQEHPDSEETYMQNIVSQIQKELADTKIKLSTCETTLKVSANHCRELEEEKESMQTEVVTLRGRLRETENMHTQLEKRICDQGREHNWKHVKQNLFDRQSESLVSLEEISRYCSNLEDSERLNMEQDLNRLQEMIKECENLCFA